MVKKICENLVGLRKVARVKFITFKLALTHFIYVTKKPFLILIVIYSCAMFSIIRANFNYIDDLGRTAYGYRGWHDFCRFISNYLSIIIHSNKVLTDISPLPQLLAVIFISLASIIILYAFSDKKRISYWSLICVLPVGLMPHFLQCMSYKFDSPYMALSVLAAVFPLLFIDSNLRIFTLASLLGTLTIFMTYQAASGIPVLVLLFWLFRKWNEGERFSNLLKLSLASGVGYIFACAFLRIVLMPQVHGYREVSLYPLNKIVQGIVVNFAHYFQLLRSDLPREYKVLILALVVLFFITLVFNTKRNKILACINSTFVLLIGCISSYGLYLALEKPNFSPHCMYGFGVFLAVISVTAVSFGKNYFLRFVSISLAWCFLVFSFTYGNALAEQKRYTDFRITLAMSDLNKIVSADSKTKLKLQLNGEIGKAPVINRMAKQYPILNRLIPKTLGGGWHWNNYYFFNYFALKNIQNNTYESYSNGRIDFRKLSLPLVFDSRYHKIQSDGTNFLITFK